MAKVVEEPAAGGLVERDRDPADRRRVLVTLTPAGRRALDHQSAQALAVQDSVPAPLSPDERSELHRLLLRVYRRRPLVPYGAAGRPARPGTLPHLLTGPRTS